ncbi:MAG: hypothetical protein HKM93_01795 [Desulfobacteraceae bacterium]|nr:hypothetical protein [Desulfobacteraceae bacterium]
MAWGSKTQIATALSVAGTELFSDSFTLNPAENANIQIIGNSSGTTDDLIISLYTTLDESTENWDTVPLFSQELDCTDGNDNDITLLVTGVYKARLGFARTGTTDTITTNAYIRKDGVNL